MRLAIANQQRLSSLNPKIEMKKKNHEAPSTHLSPSHPQHKLERWLTGSQIECNGCMEDSIGHVYKCHPCVFDLHEICALQPLTIKPLLYENCEFLFHSKPPATSRGNVKHASKTFVSLCFTTRAAVMTCTHFVHSCHCWCMMETSNFACIGRS